MPGVTADAAGIVVELEDPRVDPAESRARWRIGVVGRRCRGRRRRPDGATGRESAGQACRGRRRRCRRLLGNKLICDRRTDTHGNRTAARIVLGRCRRLPWRPQPGWMFSAGQSICPSAGQAAATSRRPMAGVAGKAVELRPGRRRDRRPRAERVRSIGNCRDGSRRRPHGIRRGRSAGGRRFAWLSAGLPAMSFTRRRISMVPVVFCGYQVTSPVCSASLLRISLGPTETVCQAAVGVSRYSMVRLSSLG